MANSYKDVIITPNRSSTTADPNISLRGGNTSVNTEIVLKVYPDANGTLSFEGSAGQLFSVTNDLTGSIFAVSDVSGIPSIEVFANGNVVLAQFSGNVGIGNATPAYKLDVAGDIRSTTRLVVGNSTVNVVINSSSVSTTGTVGFGNTTITGDLIVSGNVFFNGTTTNVNSTNLVVEDKNIILGDVATPTDVTADGGGITLKGATDKTLNWVDATDAWTSSEEFNLLTGKSYRINGAVVVNSSSLGTGITSSSLTSVGTLTGLTVSGATNLQNTLAAGNTTITGFANVSGNVYVGNSTVFWTANSTTINVGTTSVNSTVIAVGANVTANVTSMRVGNTISSSRIGNNIVEILTSDVSTAGVVQIIAGNSTVNAYAALLTQSDYGSLELGGTSGALIDFKQPYTEDYDHRIQSNSTGLHIVGGSSTAAANVVNIINANVNVDSGTLFVDGVNNRVGIGNTAPTVALQVTTGAAAGAGVAIANFGTSGSANRIAVLDENGTGNIPPTISSPGASWGLGLAAAQATTSPIIFYTGAIGTANERMRLNDTGLGIGSTAPASRLHVRQDLDGTARTIIQNRNASGTPISEVAFISGSFDITDSRYAYIQSGGTSSPYLAFGTGAGATPTTRMIIAANGNVGIGNSAPTAPLCVNGNTILGNATTTSTLTVYNSGADGNTATGVTIDVIGPVLRIGDAFVAKTFANGVGIKLHDSGQNHFTVGQIGGNLVIAETSSDGNSLYPATRTNIITANSTNMVIGIPMTFGSYTILGSTGQTTLSLTTSATTANQVVATTVGLASATWRSVEYLVQVTSGSAYQLTKIGIVHDGTTVYKTEYATVLSGALLATFDADINSGTIRLLTTPVNAVTVYKGLATFVAV